MPKLAAYDGSVKSRPLVRRVVVGVSGATAARG